MSGEINGSISAIFPSRGSVRIGFAIALNVVAGIVAQVPC